MCALNYCTRRFVRRVKHTGTHIQSLIGTSEEQHFGSFSHRIVYTIYTVPTFSYCPNKKLKVLNPLHYPSISKPIGSPKYIRLLKREPLTTRNHVLNILTKKRSKSVSEYHTIKETDMCQCITPSLKVYKAKEYFPNIIVPKMPSLESKENYNHVKAKILEKTSCLKSFRGIVPLISPKSLVNIGHQFFKFNITQPTNI